MKYPTKINWNGTSYIAPKGYYFLQPKEKLIDGDGYINSLNKNLEMYLNGDMKFINYYDGPSVRKIPVEIPAPKLQYKLITDITVGDLFVNKGGMCGVLITSHGHHDFDPKTHKYSISGLGDSLINYSNCQGISKNDRFTHSTVRI